MQTPLNGSIDSQISNNNKGEERGMGGRVFIYGVLMFW
jgi:hypothetical protein